MKPFATGCLLCFLIPAVVFAADAGSEAEPENKTTPARGDFDWSAWQRLPVLDDGRIKPLDTFADEIVTLVTGRSKWTDPESGDVYRPQELLYAWITDPDGWIDRPIIRCEFRPLRKLLNTDSMQVEVEGTYVSVGQVLDWPKSRSQGMPVYWSDELNERIDAVDNAARQGKPPTTVGATSAERALNGKVAELSRHMQAFLGVREADNIYVVPGLDPRTLTKQTNPDEQLPTWMSLGAILRPDEWRRGNDLTLVALMADDPQDLLDWLLVRFSDPRVLNFIPESHPSHPTRQLSVLPQLAQAQTFKSQIQIEMRDVKSAFDETRSAYDAGDNERFAAAMQTFARHIRRLAASLEHGRGKMSPPEPDAFHFGEFNARLWREYEPLELNLRQMSLSAYPQPNSTHVEILYNKYQPFRSAWIFFLAATVVVALSTMVKIQRTMFAAGLAVTLGAIAYSTWGFLLRIAIAGRPPVTNMYETVIWVAYVVAVLGFWFCLIPTTWPGLNWSWRLSGLPLRLKRNEQGSAAGIEFDELRPDERDNVLAGWHLPIQTAATALRLAGCVALVLFLSRPDASQQRESSFEIITLMPPIFGDATSAGSMGTWFVGMATVLLSSWYLPRVLLCLLLSLVTLYPEGRKNSAKLWEQTFGRRYFLIGALPVACFGMMLAHFVGISNPNILNPRVGSITAVLRDNYWLTIHVLTIVSSYGAGALAWGIGNLAMLYYLFGKYRPESGIPELEESKPDSAGEPIFDLDAVYRPESDNIAGRLRKAGRALKPGSLKSTLRAGLDGLGTGDAHLESAAVRPPREVSTLATFGYKSMQVAVLLLAAGTILGGLWADKSWGRFWDWDPKEVWALISLLAYLVVLHGRFAGWVGTFGTNVGSVLCFNAILFSWYGVNFVLPKIHGWLNGTGVPTEVGLHSYAPGEASGLEYVAGAVALNLLLVLVAWGRYAAETIDLSRFAKTAAAAETTKS